MTMLATLFPRRTDVRVSTVQTISPARHLVCWHAHRHRWLAHTTPRLSLPVALSMLHIIPAPYFPRARVLLSKYKMTISPPSPPLIFFHQQFPLHSSLFHSIGTCMLQLEIFINKKNLGHFCTIS